MQDQQAAARLRLMMNQSAFVLYLPFSFCALICLMQLVMGLMGNTSAVIVFYAFLPMCFFYIAMLMRDTRRALQHVWSRLEALEAAQNSASNADD